MLGCTCTLASYFIKRICCILEMAWNACLNDELWEGKKYIFCSDSVFALSRCWVNPFTIDEMDASHNIYRTSSAQFVLSLAGGQKGK